MEIPDIFQSEVKRLERLGYEVVSSEPDLINMEKHVKPSKLKIFIWFLICGLVPIIGLFFLLVPARAYYFLKGQKYFATVSLKDGEVEVT